MTPVTMWLVQFDVPTRDQRIIRRNPDLKVGQVDLPIFGYERAEVGMVTGLFYDRDAVYHSWLRGIGHLHRSASVGSQWPVGVELQTPYPTMPNPGPDPEPDLTEFRDYQIAAVQVYSSDVSAWSGCRLEVV